MNRLDRICAILIQLQSKRLIRAQDIAARFEISLRTVYRDIRSLELAGVPVIGEAGMGYSLSEGYRLPPVMFTREEAGAFLTAEKMIEQLTDKGTDEYFKEAMYKVKAVLRSADKDFLEHMDEHIAVMKSRAGAREGSEINPLQLILKSISQKKCLKISYFAQHSQENSERIIEPVGIFYMGEAWHLLAYCHLRSDYRDFRTDRIQGILMLDKAFEKKHPPLRKWLEEMAKESRELFKVVMLVKKEAMKFLGDQKYYNGFVSQREVKGGVEMTFLSCSLEGFARWFLMFGDFAKIVEPQNLKKKVQEICNAMQKNIR